MDKISLFMIAGNIVLFLLPISPFTSVINAIILDTGVLSVLNWLLPVSEMLVIVELWVSAYGAYLAFTLLLRSMGVIR